MKDLLLRMQRALPAMVTWIDAVHERYRYESLRPSDLGFRRIPGHFPDLTLNNTTVASVDTVPFPPVSKFGLPALEAMSNMPMAGITFGNMYFVTRRSSSEGIHFHELVTSFSGALLA